jgi:cell division initiation protein
MNVSPLDLRQQRFRTALRGFDKVEVTSFLLAVADDYEQALREADRLRQELNGLEGVVNEYRQHERTLKATLMAAQKLGDDMKASAEEESRKLLQDAQVRSEQMIESSQSKLQEAQRQMDSVMQKRRDAESGMEKLAQETRSRAEDDARRGIAKLEEESRRNISKVEDDARRMVGKAEEDARRAVGKADEDARRVLTKAEEESRRLLHDAQSRSELIIEKAQERLEDIQRQIDGLKVQRRDVEASIESTIRTLQETLEFVREPNADDNDDKIVLHRPRHSEPPGDKASDLQEKLR